MTKFVATSAGTVGADSDAEVRRYRVVSGCVECASDLTALRRVPGVREVRMLSATGTLAIETVSSLDDAVLLRTASASGFVLEPAQAVQAPTATDQPQKKQTRWWLRTEMIFLAIAAALLVIVEIAGCYDETKPLATALAYASVAIGIYYPARTALMMLRNKRVSINLLLVAAVAGAIPLGKVTEAACVVVIFSLGVVLESFVADRARKSIQKLMDLSPTLAERFTPDGVTELVPVAELAVGELVLVRPGTRLPTDGTVVQGVSWIDAAAITGESMPVEVEPGSVVFGGTLNGHAALRVEVAKPFEDTVLARVIREVEEAQQNRGVAQRFADRFASVYTPFMLVLAVIMVAFGPMLFDISFADALYRALVVLIVSCSCSLVLSVPVSVVSAVARAARDGVLIKGGAYLEELAKLQVVAFDKTGTLTLGRPVLIQSHPLNGRDEHELLRLAAAVEAGATHPIAEAIVQAARERGISIRPADDVLVIPGVGAQATVDGVLVAVGRVGDLSGDQTARDALAAIEDAGATPVAISCGGLLVGMFGVADELRPDAVLAIEGLRSLGITHTMMLTGDRERVAHAIARQVGIESVRAELMPEDKSAAITAIKQQLGTTAMVGDGVNDAPALATADVAIVMGAAGADVALETADVALMADDLTKLPYAVALARRSRRIIAQNVVLSLTVILLLVIAAVTGMFSLTQGVLINEVWALVIIANGLRLLRAHSSLQVIAPVAAPVSQPQSAPAAAGCGDDCGCGSAAAPAGFASVSASPVTTPSAEDGCGCGSAACAPAAAPAPAAAGCGDDCGCGSSAAPATSAQLRIQPIALVSRAPSCDVQGGCGCAPAAAPQQQPERAHNA
ncbi:MAG TPA: cation-translocating P-type ATPase [Jatrophihabitans sp.]|jgi:Cd2+/Zn2+-exporting ATPase|uniref:heavy metal translocating P-type ATPase n=1 Tax=Jatrophihabitans sp. TaxID=1932789 RepID=UPI002F0E3928